jgi:hypothetical protein
MFLKKRRNKESKKQKRVDNRDFQAFLEEKIGLDQVSELPKLSYKVEETLDNIFKDSDDYSKRKLSLPSGQLITLYYIAGLINVGFLHESLLSPLLRRQEKGNDAYLEKIEEVIYSSDISEPTDWKQLVNDILNGRVLCHVEGLSPLTVGINKSEKRSISEPRTEYQVYGPKIGFIENINTNIAMLRNFIRDPRLKVKEFTVGSLSHTKVAVLYLEEYVDPELCNQVLARMQKIDEDNLVNANQLEHHLSDYPMSIFSQTKKTERPDTSSFALSQGKIVILVDNSTFGLIVPTTLMELYVTPEDHYYKIWIRTTIRLLRFLSLFVAAAFPALYVSLVAFHPELIPTTLALTLAESRTKIPFPAPVEAFLLMFALDVLVEATMRLPSVVGQTIGIVGAIVLGSAAVEAGIVSNVLVIVISFTAISAFTVPSWELAQTWRIVRYFLLATATFLGLFGLVLGICMVTIHLCHLHSFSKPFYSPLSPLNPKEFMNVFLRYIPRKRRS